jgi:hypothetical protein
VLDYIEDFEREALGNNIDTAMKTVFVGNLSPDASDNILSHHFKSVVALTQLVTQLEDLVALAILRAFDFRLSRAPKTLFINMTALH